MKLGRHTSDWKSVNGGVPQGTLSGPELFIHMVSDLRTHLPDVKYMDDTTVIEIDKKSNRSTMGNAMTQVEAWSDKNNLGVNGSKTKDMLISFGKTPELDPLVFRGNSIERVNTTKLLGVIISDDLKWSANTDYLNKKAGRRIHYLRCLKRAGLKTDELVRIYLALIRSVCEYACPVWASSLTLAQSKTLESVQRRALRIILPYVPYKDACTQLGLPLLSTRREQLCAQFFKSMTIPGHKLNDMIPEPRDMAYKLRTSTQYPLPRCKTNRYKNSLVPWCLFNCQ